MIHPLVEERLAGASPAAGKYLRNLKSALNAQGYEVQECSYVAIPGAREVYEQIGIDDSELVYKDKTIYKSVLLFQRKLINMLEKDDVVIFYNVGYFELGLINQIKRNGNKAILILADHTDSFKENGGLLRGIIAKLIALEFKKFNYGIALSEYAKRFFHSKAKIVVIEGGIDISQYVDYEPSKKTDKVKFMYAGTLSEVTGVDILLDAISMWQEEDVEFYISGKGVLGEKVRVVADNDKRIKFIGFIPDKDYYELMKQMNVFINPRNMNLEQNQNNFPSKVLEYLATGRLVISTKFPGWEKFRDVVCFVENDARSLVKGFEFVKGLDSEKVTNTFFCNRFYASNFDWNKQAKTIVELVRNSNFY